MQSRMTTKDTYLVQGHWSQLKYLKNSARRRLSLKPLDTLHPAGEGSYTIFREPIHKSQAS